MHPLNKILSPFGLQMSRTRAGKVPRTFWNQYYSYFKELKKKKCEFVNVFKAVRYDIGAHPVSYVDLECEFAAKHIFKVESDNILDVGSYRLFIIGLLSKYNVTTLDVRDRESLLDNEAIYTNDAKNLEFPDSNFDVVVSLCALEHFGLGRYGDDFDIDADKRAFGEMLRVLKPGGSIVFTTSISNAPPSIAFNAHRIYNHEMIQQFCDGLVCEDEMFISMVERKFCSMEEVTKEPELFDIYCGCWRKP